MAKGKEKNKEELEKEIKTTESKSPDDYAGKEAGSRNQFGEEEKKSPDDFDAGQDKEAEAKEKQDKKGRKKDKKKVKVDELEEKLNGLNDKYLRLYSEFDNFRKRTMKEKVELRSTAAQELIEDLLPVLDDFERAIKSIEESDLEQSKDIKEGILLIYNKFKSTLKAKGLEEIDTKEKEFDTDFHEAVTQIPAPDKKLKGKVVDEIQKGYLLNGKVIRFAKVVVGS